MRAALVLALALLVSPAVAQDGWGRGQKSILSSQPVLTGNPVKDIETAVDKTVQKATTDITTFLNNLADIQDAVTLSTQIPGLQDPVGNACWQQFSPIQALIKAHPLPLTLKLASDIEAARLAAIAMNKVCANPNCGQMFVDATNAANALTGNPLNVSLSSLCSKVPVIGTAAVQAATSSPALVGTTSSTATTTTTPAQ